MFRRRLEFFFAAIASCILIAVNFSAANSQPTDKVDFSPPKEAATKSDKSKNRPADADPPLVVSEEPVAGERTNRVYHISPGDRLRIQFYQREELSGERIVRGDGHIFLPLLGSLRAAGRTRDELEELVLKTFEKKTERTPLVSVDIIEYRPIYVIGDVNRPGTVVYRPGITPIQVLALSGGVLRLASGEAGEVALLREQQSERSSLNALKLTQARLARLQAEQNRKTTIETVPQLVNLVGAKQAMIAMAAERQSLRQNMQLYKKEEAHLQQSVMLIEQQLKAHLEKLETIKAKQNVQRRENKEVSQLLSRKLTPRRRYYEQTYALSSIEKDISETMVDIARTRLQLFEKRKELENYWPEQKRRLEREILAAKTEIDGYRLALRTSRAIIARMGGNPVGNIVGAFARPKVTYSVMQLGTGIFRPLGAAGERTALMPGDVLQVTLGKQKPLDGDVSSIISSDVEAIHSNTSGRTDVLPSSSKQKPQGAIDGKIDETYQDAAKRVTSQHSRPDELEGKANEKSSTQ